MRRGVCTDCELRNSPIANVADALARSIAFDEQRSPEERQWLQLQPNQSELRYALSKHGQQRCNFLAKALHIVDSQCPEVALVVQLEEHSKDNPIVV